jgi:DeoR/GlpR family transcriptional regulator of sugar metabolism
MDKAEEQTNAHLSKQQVRQRQIADAVLSAGSVRIESLAEKLGTSLMTVHRDLDELQDRGILRKTRGLATALSSTLVESSDLYRIGQETPAKMAIAEAALDFIEPGQSLLLDDSTTVLQVAKMLQQKAPLTVITNVLTLLNELNGVRGISLVGLGGTYHNWCSAFMGGMTAESIKRLRADVLLMSTAAISDGTCFHQSEEAVATKRAMFEVASKRILLVDHTKFDRRALHALARLSEFDHVIVDEATNPLEIEAMRSQGIDVIVAGRPEL